MKWETGDIIEDEHRRFSNCELLNGLEKRNIPQGANPLRLES